MGVVHPGGDSLDYQVCQYGSSRLLVRGPKTRLVPPYLVFIGGSDTYGRFIPAPFAHLVGARLGQRVVNLSCINAGLDAFAEDSALLAVTAGADKTVIEIVGAANLSNEYYTVHPRRNDRFIAATPALRALFPEVDFTEFSFTGHLLQSLEATCAARFRTVAEALKDRWRVQMHRLIAEANGPVILLWIADTPPPARADTVTGGTGPALIDAAMLHECATRAQELVCVVPSAAARSSGLSGMSYTDFDAHIAARALNVAAHEEIAAALARPLAEARQSLRA